MSFFFFLFKYILYYQDEFNKYKKVILCIVAKGIKYKNKAILTALKFLVHFLEQPTNQRKHFLSVLDQPKQLMLKYSRFLTLRLSRLRLLFSTDCRLMLSWARSKWIRKWVIVLYRKPKSTLKQNSKSLIDAFPQFKVKLHFFLYISF